MRSDEFAAGADCRFQAELRSEQRGTTTLVRPDTFLISVFVCDFFPIYYHIHYRDNAARAPFAERPMPGAFQKRSRKGLTGFEAEYQMRNRNYFGSMMVEHGKADAFISGLTRNYPIALRPALDCIGMVSTTHRVAGMHIMMAKSGPVFFADTTVNIDIDEDSVCEMVGLVHDRVKSFQIEPRIALISYSNFGSSAGKYPLMMQKVVKRLHADRPDILVDGEMQPVYAIDGDLRSRRFPFNKLGDKSANVFIFSGLSTGNAVYQIMRSMGNMEAIGPVLLGFKKSVHILHHSSSVREILNMVALAVSESQDK